MNSLLSMLGFKRMLWIAPLSLPASQVLLLPMLLSVVSPNPFRLVMNPRLIHATILMQDVQVTPHLRIAARATPQLLWIAMLQVQSS